MKECSRLLVHWQLLTSLIFGIVVYCFWFLLYPYMIVAQERLFVYDADFWHERSVCEYFNEFFLQFFHNVSIGAFILVLICLAVQYLSWIVISIISKRRSFYYLSYIPAIIACYLLFACMSFNQEEMEYDWLLRKGNWNKIINKGEKEIPQSLACQNVIRLAMFQTGQISENDFLSAVTLTNDVLSNRTAAFIMSDVYIYSGMINMAQRASMDAILSIEDFGMSGRAFQRLAETALVTGQYKVARKYMLLLEGTLFYRSWAIKSKPLVEHPELIKKHPVYGKQQDIYKKTKDILFN